MADQDGTRDAADDAGTPQPSWDPPSTPVPPPPAAGGDRGGTSSGDGGGSSSVWKWLLGIVAALVLLGGASCAAFGWFVWSSTSAYVDVANDYLDSLAEDRPGASELWCDGQAPPAHRAVIEDRRSQNLSSVEVNNFVGLVTGGLVLADGSRHDVELQVRTVDDRGCVSGLWLDGQGLP